MMEGEGVRVVPPPKAAGSEMLQSKWQSGH
jgi:hypothetical protein